MRIYNNKRRRKRRRRRRYCSNIVFLLVNGRKKIPEYSIKKHKQDEKLRHLYSENEREEENTYTYI